MLREHEAPFTFIDLFAGIGGIRLGFEAHGGKCLFTSEWDKFSSQTYRENFEDDDHAIHGDIRAITENPEAIASRIPDHDVLLAGFPCQPFSIAGVSKKNSLGRAHGFECKTQGTLFYEIAKIIEAKQPAAFLLENVKNLRSHDKGRTYQTILDVLRNDLGYFVPEPRIIDGKHFVPQHRERIIIAGFRKPVAFDWDDLNLPDLESAPRLGAILQQESEIDKKYILTRNSGSTCRIMRASIRRRGTGLGFGKVGPDDVTRTLSARYYKDGSEILVKRGKTGTARPRRLTPRECARLMGFPDTFRDSSFGYPGIQTVWQFRSGSGHRGSRQNHVSPHYDAQAGTGDRRRPVRHGCLMVDVVDRKTRSRMMSGIRGKNTKPELLIRKGLHARGFRFRLHDKRLPGKPDLVLPKYSAVIFVHGCFWHGHDCHLFKWPKIPP